MITSRQHAQGPSITDQLAQSGRIIDCAGQDIAIATFTEKIYLLERERKSNRHGDAQAVSYIVDCFTSREIGNKLTTFFKSYLTRILGLDWDADWRQIPNSSDWFMVTILPETDIQLAVIAYQAHDDLLLFLDGSDVVTDSSGPMIMNPRSHLLFTNLGPKVLTEATAKAASDSPTSSLAP